MNWSPFGLLLLRAWFGGAMAFAHGFGKLGDVIEGNWKFADPLGIGEVPSLLLAAGAEFFGGFLVAIGLFTRPAAATVAFTMAVAAFVTHGGDAYAKMEPALLYFFAFLAIVLLGPGRWSVDALRRRA